MVATAAAPKHSLFGHPTGLFALFFAEMWERFSYYGMRALLVFYMIKGFLGMSDTNAYAVYGAYTALVYATPFIGGMIADRLLGPRRAVILGGVLMALGHLLMTVETRAAFFGALGLLICGNGFFKPNISTIVGSLYPAASNKRDAGFTVFYMGINLGAAMSPLLCGYIGERFGWHYGFGLATVGMLFGLMVFAMPAFVSRILVLIGAVLTSVSLLVLQNNPYQLAINAFVACALVLAGIIGSVALTRGGLDANVGVPADPRALRGRIAGVIRADVAVYLGAFVAVPLFAALAAGHRIAGSLLGIFGVAAFLWLFIDATKAPKVERERLYVVMILAFFTILFWSFFEQAGSSVNNFTDRNVDRVFATRVATESDVGKQVELELSQAQLGHSQWGRVITMQDLHAADSPKTVTWTISQDDVGMVIAGAEVPASLFQASNPIFIFIFGLIFSALWTFLGPRGLEPSTPIKFSLGLLQLSLGFALLWYGTQNANRYGMVGMHWLLLGYLFSTTGELCLSPVGLSMVTKLSPKRIVSTVMGAWFLATAFSNYLAAMIATFTGVHHQAEGQQLVPPPLQTVHVYGEVFGKIALAALIAGVVLLLLSPLLKRWMHEDDQDKTAHNTTPSQPVVQSAERPPLKKRTVVV